MCLQCELVALWWSASFFGATIPCFKRNTSILKVWSQCWARMLPFMGCSDMNVVQADLMGNSMTAKSFLSQTSCMLARIDCPAYARFCNTVATSLEFTTSWRRYLPFHSAYTNCALETALKLRLLYVYAYIHIAASALQEIIVMLTHGISAEIDERCKEADD